MGYRNYIGSITKKEYNKIKNFSKKALYKYKKEDPKDGYVGVYNICPKTLYEFGKYVEFGKKKFFKPVFKNKLLHEDYNDEGEFVIVEKEFLVHVISYYKERIQGYYNDMIKPFLGEKDHSYGEFMNSIKTNHGYPDDKYTFDFSKITDKEQTALFKIIEHVRDFRTEWVQLTPFDLEKGDEVTTSWKYEYGIFELVKIYKTFDWKNNIMIYYGY